LLNQIVDGFCIQNTYFQNAKAANFARGAHAEIAKRAEREKRLLEDCSQKELELQNKDEYIQQLEKE